MSEEAPPYDMLIKLVVIGDQGVGRSCLLHRYVKGGFSPTCNAPTTIGADFVVKDVEVDKKHIKLQVWRSGRPPERQTWAASYCGGQGFREGAGGGGQDEVTNRCMIQANYRYASGILLVYDVTDRASFESIRNRWMPQIRKHAESDASVILVGNKCDLSEEKVVGTEEGQKLAEEFGVQFFEGSAKDGMNIERVFSSLAMSGTRITSERILAMNVRRSLDRLVDDGDWVR